jgi:hypothetical protein
MVASGTIKGLMSAIALGVLYSFVFWRASNREGGNKVIEFGGLALGSVFVLAAAIKIPGLPGWVVPGLGILFFLLSFLMMFFLVQQAYRALRRKKRDEK